MLTMQISLSEIMQQFKKIINELKQSNICLLLNLMLQNKSKAIKENLR